MTPFLRSMAPSLLAGLTTFSLAACGGGDPATTSGSGGTSAAGSSGTGGTSGSAGSAGNAGSAGASAASGNSGTAGTGGAAGSGATGGTSGTGGIAGSGGTGAQGGTGGFAGDGGTAGAGAGGSGGTAATGGSGGIAGAGGSSGQSGTGGGGSGGTAGATCIAADCPAPTMPCYEAVCVGNQCDIAPVADGTIATTQVAGDCQIAHCEAGHLVNDIDDSDTPNDNNECTADKCDAGSPINAPYPIDAPCGVGGLSYCNGFGTCVSCTAPSQCTGQDNDCQTRSCDNGVCGVKYAPQGTVIATQTVGDCKVNQCDGTGGIVSESAPNDVQDDGNACTNDACAGGAPTHDPVPAQQSCGPNLICNGSGECVGCVTAADCPTPANTCVVAVCSAGACGTSNKANGTSCDDANACTQTSSCQAGACVGTNPVQCPTPDNCHDTGTCDPATGTCSNPAKTDGTACGLGINLGSCMAGTCNGCGDGNFDAGEQCDDGNSVNGDGCDNNCKTTGCGNGIITAGEVCDDGNFLMNDGCTACTCDAYHIVTVDPASNPVIVDDAYNGTIASMTCVDIKVPAVQGCPTTVSSASVMAAITHTWVGDLVIKLVGPTGTVVTLMNRPGFADVSDNGVAGIGNAASLLYTVPIEFKSGLYTSAELMGNGFSEGEIVCEFDNVCTFAPNAGSATPGTLNTFLGKPIAGTWKFCVGDARPGHTGTIDRVKLKLGQ